MTPIKAFGSSVDASNHWEPGFDYSGLNRKSFTAAATEAGTTVDGVSVAAGETALFAYPSDQTSGSSMNAAEIAKLEYIGLPPPSSSGVLPFSHPGGTTQFNLNIPIRAPMNSITITFGDRRFSTRDISVAWSANAWMNGRSLWYPPAMDGGKLRVARRDGWNMNGGTYNWSLYLSQVFPGWMALEINDHHSSVTNGYGGVKGVLVTYL